MAVNKNLLDRALAISYKDGLDKNGKEIIKKSTFNNVKLDAGPDAIMAVSDAISPLMPEPIKDIYLNIILVGLILM